MKIVKSIKRLMSCCVPLVVLSACNNQERLRVYGDNTFSEAEEASFFDDGFVIKKQLFTSEELKIIDRAANNAYQEAKRAVCHQVEKITEINQGKHDLYKDSRYDYPEKGNQLASIKAVQKDDANANDDSSITIRLISWIGGMQPELINLGRKAKITIPVSQLLGHGQADHLINQMHYKMPNDEGRFPWHQDIQNRRRFDSTWEDVNLDAGLS